mgnify:FL=1
MINPYHALVIDRLRSAAKEHGEVAHLLWCISVCMPYMHKKDATFLGSEKEWAYMSAVLDAAAFVEVDRGTGESDGE